MSSKRVITELRKLVSSDSNSPFFPRLTALFGVWTDEFTEEFAASIDVNEFAQSLKTFSEGVNNFERLDAVQRDKLDDELYQCILRGINSQSDEVGDRVDDAFDDDRLQGLGILSPEFGESLNTLCVELPERGQEFDDRRQNALNFSEMRDGKEPTIENEQTDRIDLILRKGVRHGKESWTAKDLKQLKKYSTEQLKLKMKCEAEEAIDRISRELFPELSGEERVTADQLTGCFSKRAGSPVTGTSAAKIEEQKEDVVSLCRSWKDAGGVIRFGKELVRLEKFRTSGSKQDSFRILMSRKGTHPIKTTADWPDLSFENQA